MRFISHAVYYQKLVYNFVITILEKSRYILFLDVSVSVCPCVCLRMVVHSGTDTINQLMCSYFKLFFFQSVSWRSYFLGSSNVLIFTLEVNNIQFTMHCLYLQMSRERKGPYCYDFGSHFFSSISILIDCRRIVDFFCCSFFFYSNS